MIHEQHYLSKDSKGESQKKKIMNRSGTMMVSKKN